MIRNLIDIIFPPRCIGCNREKYFLCSECLLEINTLKKSPVLYDNIFAVFSYDDEIIKKAIWLLKFKGVKDIASVFSETLVEKYKNISSDNKIKLIPIPSTRSSFRNRGYNQSLLLSLALRDKYPELFVLEKDVLRRKSNSKRQTDFKRKSERLKNIKDTFFINNPEKIIGESILILDDVVTTGATMREADHTLTSAGAVNIYCLALAYRG